MESLKTRDGGLSGYVAIVTGGARGIGFATTLELLSQGACVSIFDLDPERLDDALARIPAEAVDRADTRRTNVLDEQSVTESMADVEARFSGIDILVNNVGGTGNPPRLEADWRQAERELDLCLTSMFVCSRVAAPYLSKDRRGAIVSVSSSAGRYPADLGGAPYCAGKAGVLGLTRALACELAEHGIRVNSVLPGNTLTEQGRHDWDALPEESRKRILNEVPLKRLAEPQDIARAIAFLAGPEAGYITGECVNVNGGHHMN